uniref:ADP-ribosylation factor-binding protein GGA1-like n=1 Tax=Styela clava TaxID=7725 RepID=UPI00193A0AE8|nr:ADP-ribosylation factor-binding protein GGA1-like [Styela clava]
MATANEDSLEVLLSKATSPLTREDDTDCITLFAEKVDREIEGAQNSTRMLAHKIQSPQEHEALQALVVLEYCMKHCEKSFQNEVGKYRFLNELIKVVSPKYLGEKTTQKVRDKVVQLMYVWSIGLKEQLKIRDAYQMLKQQGIVKQDPEYDDMMLIPTPPPRPEKDNLFRDEERQKRLEKLLKSKNPEDLQAANRLIKSVVMEDQNRMEKIEKRCRMLEEVSNNVRLLNEMLAQFDSDSTPHTDMETMKELHSGCIKLRPGLFRLASDTSDDEQALMDILRANDDLSRVIQSYEKLVLPRLAMDRKGDGEEANKANDQQTTTEPNKPKSSLIDLAELEMHSTSQSIGDSNNLFASFQTSASANGDLFHIDSAPTVVTTSDDIASLFASVTMTSQSTMMTSQTPMETSQHQSLFTQQSSFQPKKPTNTVPPLLPPPTANNNKGATGMSDIDMISRSLLEKTLGRTPEEKFAPRTTAKPTLNQLSSKPVSSTVQEPKPTPQSTDILDQLLIPSTSAISTATPPTQPENTGDQSLFADFMSVPPPTMNTQTVLATVPVTSPISTYQTQDTPLPILPLTDVFVPLESIKPSTLPPLTVYDNNGLRVLFHFTQDFATADRKDTLVTVISIMSTRPAAIPNIVLQVAVPKIMRVKLQTPSSTQLAAFNPIVPSPPITQIMVLANPNKREVKMRFKLDYKLDEQTSVSETGEITGFPSFEKWGCL